jgi:hypothetical protein
MILYGKSVPLYDGAGQGEAAILAASANCLASDHNFVYRHCLDLCGPAAAREQAPTRIWPSEGTGFASNDHRFSA